MQKLKEYIERSRKTYRVHGLKGMLLKWGKGLCRRLGWYTRYFLRSRKISMEMLLLRGNQLPQVRRKEGGPAVTLSLTSYPTRIQIVHQTVRSLLVQTYPADRLVLWLAKEEFPQKEEQLPKKLLGLRKYGLQICWCRNMRSYKKLIPALTRFPEDIIITFDDDILYQRHAVERLVAGYLEKPECIHCHCVGRYLPPDRFTWLKADAAGWDIPTFLNHPVGVGGCLYPPHSLAPEAVSEALFFKLAPTNDDMWFWLMGVLNGRRVNLVKNSISQQLTIPRTQANALTRINEAGECLRIVQLHNILGHYPQLHEIFRQEQEARAARHL